MRWLQRPDGQRNLSPEIAEDFDALADARTGKRTLRTHEVQAHPVSTSLPGRWSCCVSEWAGMCRLCRAYQWFRRGITIYGWGSLIQCHRWPFIGTAPYDQITAPAGAVFLGAHRANYPGNRSWAKSRPASPSKARVSLTPTPPALSPKGRGEARPSSLPLGERGQERGKERGFSPFSPRA